MNQLRLWNRYQIGILSALMLKLFALVIFCISGKTFVPIAFSKPKYDYTSLNTILSWWYPIIAILHIFERMFVVCAFEINKWFEFEFRRFISMFLMLRKKKCRLKQSAESISFVLCVMSQVYLCYMTERVTPGLSEKNAGKLPTTDWEFRFIKERKNVFQKKLL